MERFSKIQKADKLDKAQPIVSNKIGSLNIVEYNNDSFVDGGIKIAILPYFKYDGYILMSYEPNNAYEYSLKDNNLNKFLTIITDSIKNNNINNEIRRLLYDTTGVVLNDFFRFEIDGPFFCDKDSATQIYMCLIEINYNEFRQTTVPITKQNRQIIKVSLGDIFEIKRYDMISQHMLLKLKHEFKLK